MVPCPLILLFVCFCFCLSQIDSALIAIALDDHDTPNFQSEARTFLTGDNGRNRWFDKHQLVRVSPAPDSVSFGLYMEVDRSFCLSRSCYPPPLPPPSRFLSCVGTRHYLDFDVPCMRVLSLALLCLYFRPYRLKC